MLGDAGLGAAASGIKEEFQGGYTGDVIIRARFERKFGIFGFSIPTIGEYEELPTLAEVPAIRDILARTPGIAASAGLISGAALLQGTRGHQIKVPVFGVEQQSYFSLFPALRFYEGAPPTGTDAWIVLPRSRADELERAEGVRPAVGDILQCTMASGTAFTIRAVRLAGLVDTSIKGDASWAAVYTDPSTLRALLGLSLGNTRNTAGAADTGAIDINDMFADPAIQSVQTTDATGLDLVSQYLSADSGPASDATVDPRQGAWHFMLSRLDPGAVPGPAIAAINAALAKAGINAEAVGWLPVAGINASILFLLKTVFEIGIGILAGVVILVLTNGLAFSVLEQTKDIGTMRAIGARKAFVSRLYLLEALMIVLAGSVAGLGLSAGTLDIAGRIGIPVTNSYLYALFGTSMLRPAFQFGSAGVVLLAAALISVLSSVYPIRLATRVSEATSMAAE
jgi:putative ABC transport system permease protein